MSTLYNQAQNIGGGSAPSRKILGGLQPPAPPFLRLCGIMAKYEDVVQSANFSGSVSKDIFQLLGWYRGEEKGWNRIARYPRMALRLRDSVCSLI